jgi:transposase
MLTLPASVRIYLASEAVDLRRGFDALAAAARSTIGVDPLSGHLFVFLNRDRNRAKLLFWEASGFWLFYKRLEVGRFKRPTEPGPGETHLVIAATDLALMLEGIDLRGATRRRQWAPKNDKT